MFPGKPPGKLSADRQRQLLAGVATLVIVPFLFIGGPDWSSGPVYKSAWNLGHILLFALLTFAIRPWHWLQGWRLWLVVTGVLLAAGILIEQIQYGQNREADWRDLLRNLVGSWLILAWRPLFLKETRTTAGNWLLVAFTTLLLLVELGSVARIAAQQFQMNRQLPALYDFRRENPGAFWSGALTTSTAHAREGSKSLEISLGTETYSGVTLDNF
ncbi:MAG: succinyl-CoA synthetase subunit beta, partial [Marinobacter sp.]|nr:succinyl-CoA synthetase subunit beta [Marinobacter sp.]